VRFKGWRFGLGAPSSQTPSGAGSAFVAPPCGPAGGLSVPGPLSANTADVRQSRPDSGLHIRQSRPDSGLHTRQSRPDSGLETATS